MLKFLKYLALAILGLSLLVVISAFCFKGYGYIQSSLKVRKINKCLESGGCIDPNTMVCGSYMPNDPQVMCEAKKTENQ